MLPRWQAAKPPGSSDARPPARASSAGGGLPGLVRRSAEQDPGPGSASPCSAPRSVLRVCLGLLFPASPVLPAPHPGMPAALQPGTARRLLAPNQAPCVCPSPAFTIGNRTPAPSHSGNWNAWDAGMASPALTGGVGVSVCTVPPSTEPAQPGTVQISGYHKARHPLRASVSSPVPSRRFGKTPPHGEGWGKKRSGL